MGRCCTGTVNQIERFPTNALKRLPSASDKAVHWYAGTQHTQSTDYIIKMAAQQATRHAATHPFPAKEQLLCGSEYPEPNTSMHARPLALRAVPFGFPISAAPADALPDAPATQRHSIPAGSHLCAKHAQGRGQCVSQCVRAHLGGASFRRVHAGGRGDAEDAVPAARHHPVLRGSPFAWRAPKSDPLSTP